MLYRGNLDYFSDSAWSLLWVGWVGGPPYLVMSPWRFIGAEANLDPSRGGGMFWFEQPGLGRGVEGRGTQTKTSVVGGARKKHVTEYFNDNDIDDI